MNDLGQRLRARRAALGMTQDALAQKLCVTRQAVSNWERGKTEPDLDTLLQLAHALEVEPSTLLAAAPSPGPRQGRWRKAALLALGGGALLGLTWWAAGAASRFGQTHYLWGASYLLLLSFAPACFLLCYGLAELLYLAGLRPLPPRARRLLRAAAICAALALCYGSLPLLQVSVQTLWLYTAGQRDIAVSAWPLPFLEVWARIFLQSWAQFRLEVGLVGAAFAFSQKRG